jgi:hypothetical protein
MARNYCLRVELPDGSTGIDVDVYDDEDGKQGDVQATLAVEEQGIHPNTRRT